MDPEYDLWYRMLNCGLRLPASTGSDWFLSSGNRVYVHTGGAFSPEEWFSGLKEGRTFITNGPALVLTVDGRPPGETVHCKPGGGIEVSVSWRSHYAVGRVEIIHNGAVAAHRSFPSGSTCGQLEADVQVAADGWVAARISSHARDSFRQPVFAHTSPVYVVAGQPPAERHAAAAFFERAIGQSLEWVGKKGRFHSDQQRERVRDLFRQGRKFYADLGITGDG